jgi:hypothetical protein
MKKHLLLGVLGITAIVVGYGQPAEASAILNFRTGAASALCDTRVALSATNCGAGFVAAFGGDTIAFVGAVGTWNIDTLAITTSNSPGTATLGKINLALGDVRHIASPDEDLTVDFGHDNFSAPPGDLNLSATGAASYDVAQVDGTFVDSSQITGYASNANDMAIPGGTSATALDIVTHVPGCFPLAGNSQSCAMNSPDVAFTHLAGLYSLAARQVLHQHVSPTDQTGYLGKAAVVPIVPEPATLVLFGSGLITLAAIARRRRKQL